MEVTNEFHALADLIPEKMAGLKAVLDAETNGKFSPSLPGIESRPSIPIDCVI
jgi:hypothetical protein